ncbi:MAG: DUF11 domain-containing protein [Chloroflexi bacterium]|nr:DUF11 domain-containing protein [Chloroflexota bacterium]
MTTIISKRTIVLGALVSALAVVALLSRWSTSSAMPDYATKTGQACGACHTNPAGGGALTAKGQAFQAVSTRIADPAGAWAQVSGTAAPAATAPEGLKVTIEATLDGSTATYSITLKNAGSKDVGNIYVAGGMPSGSSLLASAAATPAGGSFMGLQGETAAWLLPSIPAGGSAGPFSYRVNSGSATNLAARAFAHWLSPSDATALSADVVPLSATQKSINDTFNKYSADQALWRIQPGTAPRMMELTEHFNVMWFAARAGNWEFADFEIYRSDETVKTIPVVRPAREAGMKAWWEPTMKELRAAATAKDLNAFTQAYDKAIAGCNSCHVASTGGGFSLKGVKVIRPAAPIHPNLDYSGN